MTQTFVTFNQFLHMSHHLTARFDSSFFTLHPSVDKMMQDVERDLRKTKRSGHTYHRRTPALPLQKTDQRQQSFSPPIYSLLSSWTSTIVVVGSVMMLMSVRINRTYLLQQRIMETRVPATHFSCYGQLRLERSHCLTADHISKTRKAIDKFISSVRLHPEKRDKADPYYLIHDAGELVYGTALVFHGYGQTPRQCRLLSNYLFENGFNIYQPCLARHYLNNPNKNWPQVDLKPTIKETIRTAFLSDEVIAVGSQIQPEEVMERLMSLSPEMSEIIAAINEGDCSKDFERFFDSNHLDYFKEAEKRLEEIQALPGPLFTIGISMGGATALTLANTNPDAISKTVGYAPLLKTIDDARRQLALALGPLDVKDTGWEPGLEFTLGCLAAIDLCGNRLNLSKISNLAKVPTFLAFTEAEDSADYPTQVSFAERLKAESNGAPHLYHIYKKSLGVPHAMVDPNELPVSNKYWKTMYQETFRFLTTGDVVMNQLDSLSQDPNLPQVAEN